MPKAQQYLNQNYSKEIKELNLANQNLTGPLTIQGWPNLESIKCGNNNLTSIELLNLPKLNYFHVNNCQLNYIIISNCPNITEFNAANNLLTDTNFLNKLNPEKLTHLSVHSNNFQEQDLSFLSKFTNLEKLFIDNHSKEKLDKDIYNRFVGSLQPLQNLTNLKWINVANTDIDSGLEYLLEGFQKICLINSWERKNASYLDIRWEIERSIRFPNVTEKLIQEEKNEPPFVKDWYRIAPWRQARNLHGAEIFKKHEAQKWLNEKYPPHTNRQHYKEMTINDKNLMGELDLTDFTSLEKLECSYNQLTNLNLSNCENLIELNCSNNELINSNFLDKIPNKEKLEKLDLSNNPELTGNLNFLTTFINLKELNISNCPFTGSLKPLEKTENLRTICLTNTNIDSGLDYLSDNCCELYCNPNSKNKSKKLASILAKYAGKESNNENLYNLVRWREKLRSNIILSIPTERLFVIRSNLKKFIKKWGGEVENKWYEKQLKNLLNHLRGQSSGKMNELDNLQSPTQYEKNWYWTVPQWAGRGIVGISGILGVSGNLVFEGHEIGAIAIASPVIETITSYAKQNWYEKQAEKWDEFTQDATELLDNYHELLGILKSLRGYKVGTVDQALKDLDNKTEVFLKKYDKDKNGIVDISELQEKKDDLAKDLEHEDPKKGGSSQLGDIVQAIIKLEEEINKYRRGFYYGTVEEVLEETDDQSKKKDKNVPTFNQSHTTISMKENEESDDEHIKSLKKRWKQEDEQAKSDEAMRLLQEATKAQVEQQTNIHK